MLSSLLDTYRELLALTQLHLMHEYPKDAQLVSSPSVFALFPVSSSERQQKAQPPSVRTASVLPPKPSPPLVSQKRDVSIDQTVKSAEPSIRKGVPDPLPPQSPMENTLKGQEEKRKPISVPPSTSGKVKFSLEPLHSSVEPNFKEMQKCVASALPGLSLLSNPPRMEKKDLWDLFLLHPSEILLISYEEVPLAEKFYKNIVHACAQYGKKATCIPASVLAKKGVDWNALTQNTALRCVLGHPEKAFTSSQMEALKNTPSLSLIPLASYTSYSQDPDQKREIWKSICKTMQL